MQDVAGADITYVGPCGCICVVAMGQSHNSQTVAGPCVGSMKAWSALSPRASRRGSDHVAPQRKYAYGVGKVQLLQYLMLHTVTHQYTCYAQFTHVTYVTIVSEGNLDVTKL